MHQRVAALREAIEKLSPGVAFIERKSYAQPGDGYHFRDSRGVNRFANATAVASVGIPYPNIGELAAEYQVLTLKQVAFDLPQELDGSCFNGGDSPSPEVTTTQTSDAGADSRSSPPPSLTHSPRLGFPPAGLSECNALPHNNEYDGDGILGASTQLATDFSVSEDITFQEFVNACVKAEIIQECGRLR